MDEAVTLLRAGLPANISLETEYAPDVPSVLADSTQIHQIVMNLCTNAADAIGDSQETIKVQIRKADGRALSNVLNSGTPQRPCLQLTIAIPA